MTRRETASGAEVSAVVRAQLRTGRRPRPLQCFACTKSAQLLVEVTVDDAKRPLIGPLAMCLDCWSERT